MVERENTMILLVEDSPKDRNIIMDVLTGIGYHRIYDLPSGEQAVDVVDVLPVHLILMDTEMNPHIPNSIRGYEACMRMRQDPKGKNVAIIGMSNNGYKDEWFKAGADDFLNKYDALNSGHILDLKMQAALGKYGFADARKQDVTA